MDYKAVSVEFEDRHEDQPRKTTQEIQSKINGLRVMKIHTEWYRTLPQGSLERDFMFGLSTEDLMAFQF